MNINTASADVLRASVIGLGQVLAERMVAYREGHGPFAALSDLTHVSGIGPKLLQRIAPQLTVSDQPDIPFATEATVEVLLPAGIIAASSEMAIGDRGPGDQPIAELSAPQEQGTPYAVDDRRASDAPAFIAYPVSGVEASGLPEPPARAPAEPLGQAEERADSTVDESRRPEGGIMSDEQKQNEEERPRELSETSSVPPLEMAAGATAAAIPLSARASMMSAAMPERREEEESPQTETKAEQRQAAEEEGIYADPLAEEAAAPPEAIVVPQTQPRVHAYEAPAPAPQPVVARERGFWQSALLVALGGLLGVLLTLVVISLWSGTLDFAPRREVNAISRNVDTMQANSQLAWERIDQLAARAETLDQQIARMAPVVQRVTAMEANLVQAQDELAATSAALKTVSSDLNTFRGQMTQRVNAAEADIAAMDASVTAIQDDVETISGRVQRFDAFFVALRELLNDVAATGPTTQNTGAQAPAAAATPVPKK